MRIYVRFITERGSMVSQEFDFPDRFDLPTEYRIRAQGGLLIAQGRRGIERAVAEWRKSQNTA